MSNARTKERPAGAGGASGGMHWANAGHHLYNTPSCPVCQAPNAIAIWNLARYLSGATDADLDLVRATWPDCPLAPESRSAMQAWMDAHPDLRDAILKVDPSSPPDTKKTFWTAAELLTTVFPEISWTVPGLIPEGLVVLAGRPKIGKSWLALQVAWAVGCGGMMFGVSVQQNRVLYLALEDSPRRLKQRMIAQGWRTDVLVDFYTDWPDLVHNDGLVNLQGEIQRGGYKLVIIDTLSRAARYDQSDITEATAIWGNLQRMATDLQVTILVIDHHRKPIATIQDVVGDLLGSTGKGATADAILGLYRERGKPGAILHIIGRDVEERQLALSWDAPTGLWSLLGDADEVWLRDRERKVLSALANLGGRACVDDIAKHLEDNKGSVSRVLISLLAGGKVRRERQGHKVFYSIESVPG